jgi:hypothetical protein
METLSRLPKGLWYEPERRRYRVRKYRNGTVYGPYYFRTLEEAYARLQSLNEELAAIPKVKRKPVVSEESQCNLSDWK